MIEPVGPYTPMIGWAKREITRGAATQSADRDDLEQELAVILVTAGRNYVPDGRAKFSTYAAKCLLRGGAQYLRDARRRVKRGKNTRGRRTVLFSEIATRLAHGNHNLLARDDMGHEPTDTADEYESLVARCLGVLKARERMVLGMRFGLDGGRTYTLLEVGARLGVSRGRVRSIEANAMTKLRRAIEFLAVRRAHAASAEGFR